MILLKKLFKLFFCCALFFICSLTIKTHLFAKTQVDYSTPQIKKLFDKLEKKVSQTKTVYAEIETIGVDQDNQPVKLFVNYWRSDEKIKKIMFDKNDTVTTIINGNEFLTHYANSGIVIKNLISKLSADELEQFKSQNYFLDKYKPNIIKKNYKILEFTENKNLYSLKLQKNVNKNEIVEVIIDNKTLDFKNIKIIKIEKNKKTEYSIFFKKLQWNMKIADNIFDFKINNAVLSEEDFEN